MRLDPMLDGAASEMLRRGDACKVYFDTTDAGPQLAEYQYKAGEQNETVLWLFQAMKRPLSPSEVLAHWPGLMNKPP